MRLIDADACPALFDAEFKETERLILDGEKHLDNLAEGFMEAHNVIRSMPTIDAAPVVHGRWIARDITTISQRNGIIKSRLFSCSHCERSSGRALKPYCPNCGAKMDLNNGEA